MKYWLPLLLTILMVTTLKAQTPEMRTKEPYGPEFRQADSLINEGGLPQSAVTILQNIYIKAKAANQPVQMLKAQLYLMQAATLNQEGADTANIRIAVKEAKAAVFPYDAIWHSIAAQLYFNYYQQHRWQILQRTAVATDGRQPLEEWDAPHFFRVIASHYDASLENERGLRQTNLKEFAPLLTGNKETRYLRPTLFDLLAFRAISYYGNDEQDITRRAYQFTISNPEYLSGAATFLQLAITSKDSSSKHLRALQLYQDLLKMHLADAVPDALIDADLQRLKFVYDHATFAEKKAMYSKALNRIAKAYPENATAAEAAYRMIALQYETPRQPGRRAFRVVHKSDRDLKAIKAALEIIAQKFPKSEGGTNARRMINELSAPTLEVQGEEAILPGEYSKVLVTYKNVPQVWGRVIRLTEDEYKKIVGPNEDVAKKILLVGSSFQSFTQVLPAADDYESHTTELPVQPLEAGMYALLLSGDQAFSASNNNLSYVLFQASNLSMITQQGTTNGYVLHRKTGKPLSGAQLDFYEQEWKNSKTSWVKKRSATANKDGAFSAGNDDFSSSLAILHYGQELFYANASIYGYGKSTPAKPSTETFFFTDRSIYRPGQTIYFKGIMVVKEPVAAKTHIVANTPTKVSFKDANGQVVKTLSLTTNEFGSFSGSFTAPQVGLTGNMSISNELGEASISVEEYKRPKYEVTFDTLKSSYALNEKVTVTGAANAYAGNVIDGATVKYRVVRETRWPYPWLYRRMIMPSSADLEIKNGTVETDAQGKFKISFTALPDETVDSALQPIFNYTIYADVTDAAGETHSATQSISVGYRGIQITAAIPEKALPQDLENLPVSIENLNGQPLVQQATIIIAPLIAPAQTLRARLWPQPELYVLDEASFRKQFPLDEYRSESKPVEWTVGAPVYQQSFTSNARGLVALPTGTFKGGWYLITITAKDKSSGAIVTEKKYLEVQGGKTHAPISISLNPKNYEPGQTVTATITSGFGEALLLQTETRINKRVETTQRTYQHAPLTWTHAVTEADRGGIDLQWLMVKDNRVYTESQRVNIPWSNKDLTLAWATHRDKLAPRAKETWTVTIKGNKKEQVAAELLAGMYDASLDALQPYGWSGMSSFFPFVWSGISWNQEGGFGVAYNRPIASREMRDAGIFDKEYENLRLSQNYSINGDRAQFRGNMTRGSAPANMMALEGNMMGLVARPAPTAAFADRIITVGAGKGFVPKAKSNKVTLPPQQSPILIRKNLQETAFFFPQLKTDAAGNVQFSFTLPEALTEWKFMALAHTKDMAIGQLTGKVKTQKDLMVQPNLPRFLRQGDDLIITTKISNLSNAALSGTAMLEIVDAQTLQSLNLPFRLKDARVAFTAATAQSTTASWRIHVPESRYEPVLVRITAQSGSFTDGEENMLPVLTNRTLVTETLPLWMNGTGTKNFTFDKLLHSGDAGVGATLAQHRLTVEYTANPAWYAVQALPYLMEYPYECAEQTFNRYYANALAAHILDKAPRVKEIFAQWKDSSALQSSLQKNEALKSALLEETPWVMEAKDEAQQMRNIALLFDSYKISAGGDAALQKLEDMQQPGGAFPWFKGGGADRIITQYIATGIARLQQLGINTAKANGLQQKMQVYLDRSIQADYDALLKTKAKAKLEDQQLDYTQLQYLYMHSFAANKAGTKTAALTYYQEQAAKYWPKFNTYGKGMIALALSRMGDATTVSNILQSLRETAIHKEELGMYWMDAPASWYWYEAPVEQQALLIELFGEVAKDTQSVDELKRWLLKQKQTQNWKTTKATADACYALLLNGSQWLTSTPTVSIKLGDQTIHPTKAAAGTGYFKQSLAAGEIKPAMGNIQITVTEASSNHQINKSSNPPSYGAIYWQYFENLDKITTATTPLALRKQLFIERNTDRGPVLEEIKEGNTLKVGDKVKVRIVLQADRDMEYLHLKDMRAAAFEPVNVLSGYRYQGGLGYYESTRDASSNFFISYLRKGTYVFEYPVNVMAKGDFSNGISTIQCMYAPEFSSHSDGIRVVVE